jgi:hypothetical protein
MESPEDQGQEEETPQVPQEPAGDAVEGGTSHDSDPGGGVAEQDKISADDVPPEAQPEGEE